MVLKSIEVYGMMEYVVQANPHSQQVVLERAIRLIYKKLLFEREYCNINVVIDSHMKKRLLNIHMHMSVEMFESYIKKMS